MAAKREAGATEQSRQVSPLFGQIGGNPKRVIQQLEKPFHPRRRVSNHLFAHVLFVRFAVPVDFDRRFSELVERQFAALQSVRSALQNRCVAERLRAREKELHQETL